MSTYIRKLIKTAVMDTPGFPRASNSVLETFCADVSLVCLGFRTAYLVDFFSISEVTANLLMKNLRKHKFCMNLIALYHRDLCQLFLCNVAQLHARVLESISDSPWTMFIKKTEDNYVAVAAQPAFIQALCQGVLEDDVAFNLSISRLSPHEMISLAGFLLEYPFSHSPEEHQSTFLANISLDVFECKLSSKNLNLTSHSFMKFSRPSTLSPPPDTLIKMLKERFLFRTCPKFYTKEIDVHWESVTMDRVAFIPADSLLSTTMIKKTIWGPGRFGAVWHVNTIAPGAFESAMTARMPEKTRRSSVKEAVLPRRFGRPEEFSKTVRWMIECQFVTGETVQLSEASTLDLVWVSASFKVTQ